MSNKIITNKHASTIDLSPLRDVFDVALALRPKGTKGDSREISEETAEDAIIKRVRASGWISVHSAHVAAPAPAEPNPTPAPAPVVPKPAPVITAPPPPTPEPVAVVPKETIETLVEETKLEPTPEPPPKSKSRR